MLYSSGMLSWQDEGELADEARKVDWKRQYRLRQKWVDGTCKRSRIQLSEYARPRCVPVKLCKGIIFTANPEQKLKLYDSKDLKNLLASADFPENLRDRPAAIDVLVDTDNGNEFAIVVGFKGGQFSIFKFDRKTSVLAHAYSLHPTSLRGARSRELICHVAITDNFVLTVAASECLCLYRFPEKLTKSGLNLKDPTLISSLDAVTVSKPIEIKFTSNPSGLIASIVYGFGFPSASIGLQELRLSPEGRLLETRATSRLVPDTRPFAMHSPYTVSYSHPYLLTGHPDNLMTLYTVTSTADGLRISKGRQLTDHTSAVKAVRISKRGKAVSVGRFGEDMRVWDLEGVIGSGQRAFSAQEQSVQVRTNIGFELPIPRPQPGLPWIESPPWRHEGSGVVDWLDFDDERVVAVRETRGRPFPGTSLSVYDFA
ncbi:MAG: hypothetical protein M1814_000223 [Vezdaea aestivalis]|nr:MAG: hypothetical protein M1814_000223 [Vezdaea aestivalis]